MIDIMCCPKCLHALVIENRKVIDEHKLRADYYCPICKEVRAIMVSYID